MTDKGGVLHQGGESKRGAKGKWLTSQGVALNCCQSNGKRRQHKWLTSFGVASKVMSCCPQREERMGQGHIPGVLISTFAFCHRINFHLSIMCTCLRSPRKNVPTCNCTMCSTNAPGPWPPERLIGKVSLTWMAMLWLFSAPAAQFRREEKIVPPHFPPHM